jgi:ParD-like antitoxin of type II bacterial toxin-antitoxin system
MLQEVFMAEVADRVTRVAADLVDSAAAEGARQSRSAKQQLDHWARVGRAVSSQQTAARRRVEAALAGEADLNTLSTEEGVVFNAEIAAAIEEQLAGSHYGDRLAAQGVTTVALDNAGRLVEYRPDGTSAILSDTPA